VGVTPRIWALPPACTSPAGALTLSPSCSTRGPQTFSSHIVEQKGTPFLLPSPAHHGQPRTPAVDGRAVGRTLRYPLHPLHHVRPTTPHCGSDRPSNPSGPDLGHGRHGHGLLRVLGTEHCATHGFTGAVRDEHPGADQTAHGFTYPTISKKNDPPPTVAQTPLQLFEAGSVRQFLVGLARKSMFASTPPPPPLLPDHLALPQHFPGNVLREWTRARDHSHPLWLRPPLQPLRAGPGTRTRATWRTSSSTWQRSIPEPAPQLLPQLLSSRPTLPPVLTTLIHQVVPSTLLLAQATLQHLPHIPQQVPAIHQPAQAIPQQVLVIHQLALATLQQVHHTPPLAPAILLPVQAIHQPVLATLLLPHLTHLPYP
jgi:hypothetical protein